ncbi:hypothetical protein JQU17_22120 [Ponticoccus sp. SC2-23]|uniref:hypothetical protein n=1 Tax=Alexandriicola marinus TaxID=2081710 RepID=UPI000FDC4530|nr:hypothetical protein [Alexandriicola marinus]MBM1222930.1 hypothetical protein [Ponticoccus sp. SC6-9]MBM1227337.1 hypothetical protein [Ponticoccus sp. SC6-15]MBM1231840.1 hypothetical protein [Ponticoccus sp. SC6-38]MBM1236370.1 hypothetical protein [Ponticoccus sp. SC6-45]MBM1240878.1 hypothetical protein [Ponticoccus sp. SC6-49]MBM1245404.1 hypothetical protein [Ponticoccus sp. SC2-64]MBM1249844.1 hypothetical protein [Ponticoccus sp. SC6-42]MBM1254366.1 hypothetical protein [Pontico
MNESKDAYRSFFSEELICKVERVQLSAIAAANIKENDFSGVIDDFCYILRAIAQSNDPLGGVQELLSVDLINMHRLTRFQLPHYIVQKMPLFDYVKSSVGGFFDGNIEKSIRKTKFATFHGANIEAALIQDSDGQGCVMLSDHFYVWPQRFMKFFSPIFFDSFVKPGSLSMESAGNNFRKYIYDFMFDEALPGRSTMYYAGRQQEHFDHLSTYCGEKGFGGQLHGMLFNGLQHFIFAHEVAHIALQNLEGKTEGLFEGALSTSKRNAELSVAKGQIVELSSLYKREIRHPQMSEKRFGVGQLEEVQADYVAVMSLLKHLEPLSQAGRYRDMMPYIAGALSFFAYSENREIAFRVFLNGSHWMKEPIHSQYFLAQDLLFRSTHPTPRSRMQCLEDRVMVSSIADGAKEVFAQVSELIRSLTAHIFSIVSENEIQAGPKDEKLKLLNQHIFQFEDKGVRGLSGGFDFLEGVS